MRKAPELTKNALIEIECIPVVTTFQNHKSILAPMNHAECTQTRNV